MVSVTDVLKKKICVYNFPLQKTSNSDTAFNLIDKFASLNFWNDTQANFAS